MTQFAEKGSLTSTNQTSDRRRLADGFLLLSRLAAVRFFVVILV